MKVVFLPTTYMHIYACNVCSTTFIFSLHNVQRTKKAINTFTDENQKIQLLSLRSLVHDGSAWNAQAHSSVFV